MKHQIFVLLVLLFITSCNMRQNAGLPDADSKEAWAHEELGSQEATAKEIISIQYAFGDAMLHLDNTNATSFVTKVEVLADRLEKISRELDKLGSFPVSLREATIKSLEDDEKALAQRGKNRIRYGSLRPDVAKITNPVVDRYFLVSGSVMMKAGLLIEAKENRPSRPEPERLH